MVRLGDAVMPCVSEDISMNGLSVATDGTVREGLPIELSITLPGNSTNKID